jgi:hypothetical protein
MRLKEILKKLSIFDWLLLGLGIGFFVFLGFSLFRKENWLEIELRVMPEKYWWGFAYPPAWLAENIEIGDEEYNFRGERIAEVVDLSTYKTRGEGENIYLQVKIKVAKDVKGDKYRYNSSIVEVGGPLSLHLDNNLVPGIVLSINKDRKEVEKRIQVKGHGKNPSLVESVKVGDQIKDGQGNVIAEVLAKKATPSKVIYLFEQGRIIYGVRPTYDFYDVALELKIKAKEIDGDWYYQGVNKIVVGNGIELDFPHVILDGLQITEVYN